MSRRENKDVPPKHIDEKLEVQRLLPDAKFPFREEGRDTDIGLNLVLISRSNSRSEDVTGEVNDFRTGIALTPPDGYYVEIIAKDDLHRHGYMLASGVIVISPGFTGEIVVPLFKFKDAEDLVLPFSAVQIVVKPAVYAHIKSVKTLAPLKRDDDFSTSFDTFNSSAGMYIPNPQSSLYHGDMQAYQDQVSRYPRGVPRPQSAPKKPNHMF